MNRTPRIVLQAIGVVAILCAAFGLCFNALSLSASFSGEFTSIESQYDVPYFYPAVYIMSAVCIGCYAVLIVFGIQLLRGRVAHLQRFATLLVFEVVYFVFVGMVWHVPGMGQSVGAATGVANFGLMAQFLILFPLWAPLLAFWARRHLHDSTNAV